MPWFYISTDDNGKERISNGGADATETQALIDREAGDNPTWSFSDPFEETAEWYDQQPKAIGVIARRDGSQYIQYSDGSTEDVE